MNTISKEDLKIWYKLHRQVVFGCHMEPCDIQELLRTNMMVLEATHDIHNESMSREPFKNNK
jgi:hypothetical protein